MTIFVKLLLAHLIGDFLLQPNSWVVHKEEYKAKSKYLYVHVLLHFGVTMLLLWDWTFWKIALFIMVSHYSIDVLKLYVTPLFKHANIPFFLDQLLHLIVLYCCAYYTNLWPHTVSLFEKIDWALVTTAFFVTFPAAIIMGKILERMSGQIAMDHESLPNAGKYIGIIERLFVLIFIVLGNWASIGLLITAKSVFRFNDLKDSNNRKLTEYILIGTLTSFGLAIVAGLIYSMIKI
ncbi:DUF3307 domain-containing protein [Aggregatimonas sangjinii]|uniref:DUF3307 domain-containing protein n=1 Tax=Aggregatimonas sangjinii TaxID=2583587 RepID=A0A5B7SNW3_9FLAO|nr:DUF3307 domain-containing protein [Aggregatimonas sangjinii]QCX00315.1 DUF3307 domain-containing protein [Aggregatimonas sangjinii]